MKHAVLPLKKLSINIANFIIRRNHYIFGLMIVLLPITAISDNIKNPEANLDEIRDAVVAQLLYLENKGQQITPDSLGQIADTEGNAIPPALLSRVEKHAIAQLAIIKKTALQQEQAFLNNPVTNTPKESPVSANKTIDQKPSSKQSNDNTTPAQVPQPQTTAAATTEKNTLASTHKNPATKEKTEVTAPNKDATIGWIYLGRFDKEQWENPTLDVKTELPKLEEEYKIKITSVNIRDTLPKKDALGELKLGKLLKVILNKQVIKVLELKRSGKSNHYWGKILLE